MAITRKSPCLSYLLTLFIIISFISISSVRAQEGPDNKEFDISDFSFEELLDAEVEIASMFAEDEMVTASTVASISPEKWKLTGARRMQDVLDNEMGVMVYSTFAGSSAITIRGYVSNMSHKGLCGILDGVPLNDAVEGSAFYQVPNWELGTLKGIEMIKGPGSAIYGSDAFHGVLALRTFESNHDTYEVEAAGAYPLYGDSAVRISKGFAGDLFRLDVSGAGSYQGDLDIEYEYEDENGETKKGLHPRKYKYKSGTGVAKLTFNPSKKVKIKTGAYATKWDCERFPGLIVHEYYVDDYYNAEIDFLMANGSVTYIPGRDISIEATGYYWTYSLLHQISFDPAFASLAASVPYLGDDYDSIAEQKQPDVYRYGGSLTVKQPDNKYNLQWVLAYSYSKMGIETGTEYSVKQISTGDLLANLGEVPEAGFSRDINSVFGQVKWGAIEKVLYILCGGRLDVYSDAHIDPQFTPRASLIFLPATSQSIKVLYGRAFKAPGASNYRGSYYASESLEVKPETIDVGELVYMYKMKKWKAKVNAYYTKWKNGIALAPTATKPRFANIAESQSYGGEAYIYYPIEPITLELGFGYCKSKQLGNEGEDDIEHTAYPVYSVNSGIYYSLEPYDVKFYLNNNVRMDMTEAPDPDSDKLPLYWRMDLNISKVIANRLELHLNGKNITNRKNAKPAVWGHQNGFEDPGVSVLLRASYKF